MEGRRRSIKLTGTAAHAEVISRTRVWSACLHIGQTSSLLIAPNMTSREIGVTSANHQQALYSERGDMVLTRPALHDEVGGRERPGVYHMFLSLRGAEVRYVMAVGLACK